MVDEIITEEYRSDIVDQRHNRAAQSANVGAISSSHTTFGNQLVRCCTATFEILAATFVAFVEIPSHSKQISCFTSSFKFFNSQSFTEYMPSNGSQLEW
ncbi:unnamed protein product [Haemonchus placei]|uniref:Uncharacterized protein n=1 Tax=Haemonchus placei TaxID=6290 RepID=A0A158QLX7_HAEPC|nr:unnamed protein product [Haemonchus placei]